MADHGPIGTQARGGTKAAQLTVTVLAGALYIPRATTSGTFVIVQSGGRISIY